MGMTETRPPGLMPSDPHAYGLCTHPHPHSRHWSETDAMWCGGYTPTDVREAADRHTCADPSCPCVSPKQGVSGETAAQHQDRVTAHDVDQHGDER